mgnify:CR=1 FL=1
MKYLKKFNEEFSPKVTNLYYKFAIPHKACGKGFIFDPETNSYSEMNDESETFYIDEDTEWIIPVDIPKKFMEKLAELIIKECADVALNKDAGYIYTAEAAGYVNAGRLQSFRMIKEHFGVEA